MSRPLLSCVLCFAACSTTPVLQPLAPPPSSLAELGPQEFPGAARLLRGFDAPVDAGEWHIDDRVLFGLRLRKGDEVHRWLLQLDVALAREPAQSSFRRRLAAATSDQQRQLVQAGMDSWEGNFKRRSWPYTVTTADGTVEHIASSAMLMVAVSVYEADGTQIGRSLVSLPAELLGKGVLRAADLATAAASAGGRPAQARGVIRDADPAGRPAAADDDDGDAAGSSLRPQVEAIVAMLSLLRVVQEDDVLAGYFWQVIEKPGLWSVLTHLGVKASIQVAFERSVEADGMPAHLPALGRAVVVPMRIDVNGSPALYADVLATDARRPFALCGGMVQASAHHPNDPSLQFDLALLAARLPQDKAAK